MRGRGGDLGIAVGAVLVLILALLFGYSVLG
jgi:hypothetical protein